MSASFPDIFRPVCTAKSSLNEPLMILMEWARERRVARWRNFFLSLVDLNERLTRNNFTFSSLLAELMRQKRRKKRRVRVSNRFTVPPLPATP
jgi:hypothetical protein